MYDVGDGFYYVNYCYANDSLLTNGVPRQNIRVLHAQNSIITVSCIFVEMCHSGALLSRNTVPLSSLTCLDL